MAGTKERKEARLKLFVEHYLQCGQADESARLAGYDGTRGSLHVRGSRLLSEAKSRGMLDKARERVEAKLQKTTEDWARKLWKQAECLDGEDPGLAEVQESWKTEAGRFRVRRWKPQEALKTLASLYVKQEEIGKPPVVSPVQVNILAVMKDENVRAALIGATRRVGGLRMEGGPSGNGFEP